MPEQRERKAGLVSAQNLQIVWARRFLRNLICMVALDGKIETQKIIKKYLINKPIYPEKNHC